MAVGADECQLRSDGAAGIGENVGSAPLLEMEIYFQFRSCLFFNTGPYGELGPFLTNESNERVFTVWHDN